MAAAPRLPVAATVLAVLASALLLFLHLPRGEAAVTVTAGGGGGAISADTAGTGGSGAWTDLGAVTVEEELQTDFAISQAGVTLRL